jgi:DNA-binding CsgD family transcriptional regulator
MNPELDKDILLHYGMPRRSGRYPWGSGEDPYQHGADFLSRVEELKKQGFTYTDETGKKWTGENAIAKSMGLTTTQYRIEKSLAKDERRMYNVATAKSLKDDGLGDTEIGRRMGVNESTVRSWLNAESEARMNQAKETANFLKSKIDEKGMIDVGTGVERELNISKEKLNQALYLLEREGYPVYKGGIPQATNPGQQTNQRVICKPGTEHKEIYNFDKVHTINDYISRDGGDTYEKKFTYPTSMDSKRLKIRYNEDGGIEKDCIIELRRGVDDLSLGESRYSQVRILVDKTHYLKGMAVYSDAKDWPDGVDVVFNTNKKRGTDMKDVLKKIKDDPDNPFGSAIKDAEQGGQYWYTDKNGKKKLGLINKRADEGDWDDWKDALPSQFLGKQSLNMAKKQLGIAKADKQAEFDEIRSLTNPTVKKHLLQKFADECDSAAVHLQAAALPGQKYHVIIPITSMKDNEVYAPNYQDGTKLALIRYPHGGTFEIPILTVNNKQATARKLLGKDVIDAVGINSKVAERLSGADFDGDTVMCIPTHDRGGKVKITSTPPLKGLEGFDSKSYQYDKMVKDADGTEHYYKNGREFRVMKNTGTEMGKISNLITDMTLAGAGQDKLARAVRHSMVVIDAEKHKLDYKQSEVDNNIKALRDEYQLKVDKNGNIRSGGASTILSRSKGEHSVLKRQGTPRINQKGKEWYDPTKPEGALLYKTADDVSYEVTRVNKRTGEVTTTTKYRTQKSTNMAETDDANTLVSKARHPMELAYADYANSMKAMANQARKELVTTGKIEYSQSAKKTYQKEVDALMSKLNTALLNTTRERAAQRMANAELNAKKQTNPNMKPGDVKKAGQQALSKYREEVGSVSRKKRNIEITDREWEAIQAGAISETKLKQILDNTDISSLRQRATPKTTSSLSTGQVNRIKAMSASYTLQQIADKLGVSTSTVSKYLKGAN